MAAKKTEYQGNEIALESFKVYDAINIKGKVSAYWHITKSQVHGLKLTALPAYSMVRLEGDGIKPILIPFANVPFMNPLEQASSGEAV